MKRKPNFEFQENSLIFHINLFLQTEDVSSRCHLSMKQIDCLEGIAFSHKNIDSLSVYKVTALELKTTLPPNIQINWETQLQRRQCLAFHSIEINNH